MPVGAAGANPAAVWANPASLVHSMHEAPLDNQADVAAARPPPASPLTLASPEGLPASHGTRDGFDRGTSEVSLMRLSSLDLRAVLRVLGFVGKMGNGLEKHHIALEVMERNGISDVTLEEMIEYDVVHSPIVSFSRTRSSFLITT